MKNKYQEALDDFESVYRNVTLDDDLTNEKRDVLQGLIDKETPMKPVKNSYGDYLCGKCNNLVWENFTPDRHERCNDKECGQVVDWSDEK
ncbi:hypothetical protein G7059_01700 [Erysipelothrix sp. HDW6A]|nr:hypothetical protein G7059_01700 [Erysipelothrix sp. HDW6A]